MKLLVLFVLVASHLPLVIPFFSALSRRAMPRSIDFVSAAFLLYYDMEIAFEAFGGQYANDYFKPFFSASERPLILAALVLIVAPWIMRLGYEIATRVIRPASPNVILLKTPALFFSVSVVMCALIASLALSFVLSDKPIWVTRAIMGEAFGPLIIVLYVPIAILGFFLGLPESRTRKGWLFIAVLSLLSVLCTLGLGERTLIFAPFALMSLFYGRVSIPRLVVIGAGMLIISTAMMPLLRSYASSESSFGQHVTSVLAGDFARAPGLVNTINETAIVGTKYLPYAGSGYVYAALLYVPRSIVPFKGVSTAAVYTAHQTNSNDYDISWGLGVGLIDELLLNFGWLLLVPGLIVYGFVFGALDRASIKYPCLSIVAILTGIYAVGYHLPASLQTFGPIAIVGIICQYLFTDRYRAKQLTCTMSLATQAASAPAVL